MVYQWMVVESYIELLKLRREKTFTVYDLEDEMELERGEGSRFIQAYLVAQRANSPKADHVLRRLPETRTTAAVWTYSAKRERDVVGTSRMIHSDIQTKFLRHLPDYNRLVTLKPELATIMVLHVSIIKRSLEVMNTTLEEVK